MTLGLIKAVDLEPSIHWNPNQHLAFAVLCQAIYDLRLARKGGLDYKADEWFAEGATEWPFCFQNVCELLDLDPQFVARVVTATDEPFNTRIRSIGTQGQQRMQANEVAKPRRPRRYVIGERAA